MIIDLEIVKVLRNALRDQRRHRILTEEEYDTLLYVNAKISKEEENLMFKTCE